MNLAKQNDLFRSHNLEAQFFGILGQLSTTQGFRALSKGDKFSIFEKVVSFDDFTKTSDPFGHHDFGRLEHKKYSIIWTIKYYDLEYKACPQNVTDSKLTRRVLTIMLANEWPRDA